MSLDSRELPFRTLEELDTFFSENPECDEYTHVDGNRIRFSDVTRMALGEIVFERTQHQARVDAVKRACEQHRAEQKNRDICAFFDPRYHSRCNRPKSDSVHHQPPTVREASLGIERYYDHAFKVPHE